MDVVRSKGQKIYLVQCIDHGIRVDGRGNSDHRPIMVERGVLRTCDGSARVRLGRTEVFAVVNAELQEVSDSSKHKHRINFSVKIPPQGPSAPYFEEDEDEKDNDNDDMDRDEAFTISSSANYHDDREKRAFREEANWSIFGGQDMNEVDQVDCEGYDSTPATDLEDALDIIVNKLAEMDYSNFTVSRNHIWLVDVEVMVSKYAGNMFDAVYLAVLAALSDFRCISPTVKHDGETGKDFLEGETGETEEGSQLNEWGIDVKCIPPAGMSYRVGNSAVVDLNELESILSPVSCWVVISRRKLDCLRNVPDDECEIIYSQMGGGGSAKSNAQKEMLSLAVRAARHLNSILHSFLKKWESEKCDPYRTVHLTFEK